MIKASSARHLTELANRNFDLPESLIGFIESRVKHEAEKGNDKVCIRPSSLKQYVGDELIMRCDLIQFLKNHDYKVSNHKIDEEDCFLIEW